MVCTVRCSYMAIQSRRFLIVMRVELKRGNSNRELSTECPGNMLHASVCCIFVTMMRQRKVPHTYLILEFVFVKLHVNS